MKKLLLYLMAVACLSGSVFAQTKIDLSKQKGIVPVVNGGTGNPGTLSVSTTPGDLQFGTVKTATSSPARSINISNTGQNPVTINTVTISGAGAAHFATGGVCANEQLDGGATCAEPITYNPASAVSETALITVTTSAPVDPQNPLTVTLAGTGTGAVTFPLTFNCSGTGSGTIVSNETPPLINATCSNGSVGGVFTNNYATGSSPIITATANAGSTFGLFTGCGISTSPSACTVSAATVINAKFDITPINRTLNVTGLGQGKGTVTSNVNDINDGAPLNCTSTAGVLTGKCNGTFADGTAITLTETPFAGCSGGACTFTTWGGAACTTASTCLLTLTMNTIVTASFAAPAATAPVALLGTLSGGTNGSSQVSGALSEAATAGDTYVVGILFNDNTSTVSSVTDTKGDTFIHIGGSCSPKRVTSLTNLSMYYYYAANVAASAGSANTITAVLNANPSSKQLFVHHYSGLTATPFDVCSGGTGASTAMSSGSLTTTVAGDLLVAFNNVDDHINTADPLFTQRINASGNDSEERQNVAVGSYTNQAVMSSSNGWLSIMAAFKAGTGGGGGTTNFAFNVICGGAGSGTVTSGGQTLTCTNGNPSGGISLSVAPNSTQIVSASPASGSGFSTYSGAGCSTTPTCTTQPITQTTTVTASFNLAGGQNFYVSTTGNDSTGNGTASNPWATISKAASALTIGASGSCVTGWITLPNSGACVHFASGTYNILGSGITLNRAGSGATTRIYYVSDTKWGAKLVGTNNNQIMITQGTQANYQGLYGFEMTYPNGLSVVVMNSGHHREVQFNYIHDVHTTSGCINPRNGIIHETTAPSDHDVFNGNIVRHFGNSTCGTNGLHGIYADGSAATITNNVISGGAEGWGIQKQYAGSAFTDCSPGTISNNTIFNNAGGIIINDEGNSCRFSNWTVNNNLVVNNGVSGTGGGGYGGIVFWTFNGNGSTLMSNNMVYGNLPFNFGLHGNACTPPSITCPATNTKTDALITDTFTAFAVDTNASPASSYNVTNYRPKSTSNAINGGTTSCATSGISPCVPPVDIQLISRPQGPAYAIGAFEQ